MLLIGLFLQKIKIIITIFINSINSNYLLLLILEKSKKIKIIK